jgi:type I restriction enzyme S subunit
MTLVEEKPKAAGGDAASGDGPWELPEGWVWAKIEEILACMDDGRNIHHGWSPQCESFPSNSPSNWGVLKTTSIQPAEFLQHENKQLPAGLQPRPNIEVHVDDLLLTCAGPRSRCGVACLVRETRPRLMISGKMYRFRANASVVKPAFLEAFLQTHHAWRAIDAMKTGGSDSGLNLTHDRFRQLQVPVPPIEEQRRIVARVDELFAEIAEGEAALHEARKGLDLFRRALLKAAVTGELTKDWRDANRPDETGQDFLALIRSECTLKASTKGRGRRAPCITSIDATELPKLPKQWTWARLEEIITSGPTNGYSPKKSADGSGTMALRLTATTRGQVEINTRSVKALSETIPPGSELFLKPGDLLFQRGNTIEYVGIAAVYDGPSEQFVYPDLMIRVRTAAAALTDWIWRVANSPYGRRYMSNNATGTAGTMPKISGETLRNFPVPVPPAGEMAEILRRVSDALSAVNDTAALLDAEAADAARLRQSVLKAAFEGRLAPQDPVDEPAASVLARLAAAKSAKTIVRRRGRA